MASVVLKGITKHYGTQRKPGNLILKGIDIAIEKGEFIVVVGPSGCGKSTLLRVIAGLEESSSGQIMIGDRDVTKLEPAQRDIAMVFQNYALYPHMTVRENMAYGVKLAKMPKEEIDRRIRETAKMLDIEMHLDKKPNALSGGQRQRVAMGRAIVRKPKLFLFDEPLSNLDAKLRTSTRLEIRRRHNEIGITSLYVTHDQTEAMTLADRMIILNGGNIEQFGTPQEIFHEPASTFVANFMGSPAMNLLPVEITDAGLYFQGQLLPGIIVPEALRATGKRSWIVGIRPEHIILRSQEATDTSHRMPTITTTLTLAETLGSEILLYCDLLGTMLTVKQSHHIENIGRFQLGEHLELEFPQKSLYWFDADTQKRVVL
ncbi:sn-glycerol-3-phosphate ABC transporter ATP-binding protein UgpC [Ignatzschineria ureiclastica]|uniref:sn-glycerol-3-phosphate ABC transporter ATP-binding protein UgpC n=1 Tax=Ignatzschineria ureiclastica TaxID=472582 RepID=A0A2U2AFP5_9GAMM|nr:sn-glycerol-3-phosphate ABC transporter ATP-binding protein UgpC [Ignatzschineria ureiclastica]PWD81481.1 sn-glycerol-3-phosphate ABC transporter ATP-binding protein UgpC [Ignatzschineria ureiclastica]GHA00989.1 sn-glycerol-3-phosphate import ATP-binding protein UgpC [Ignatzschineria ureiclastica]